MTMFGQQKQFGFLFKRPREQLSPEICLPDPNLVFNFQDSTKLALQRDTYFKHFFD